MVAFGAVIQLFLALCRPSVSMNLENVVQHRHQLPLAVDLVPASQGETSETQGLADIAEDRLDDAQAHAVGVATEV